MRAKALGMLLSVLFGTAHAATLDFTSVTCNGGAVCDTSIAGSVVDQSYGDIASLVDVSYRALTGPGNGTVFENFLRFWDVGYSGLTNVLWGAYEHSDYVSEIKLTPTPGNRVTLTSLQLGSWSGAARTSQLTIFDGSYNILSSPGTVSIGATPSLFSFALNSGPSGLIIQWGPDGNNVGIDNVVFSVSALPVPEPGNYLLLLAGLGVIALGTRSRRTTAVPAKTATA